MPYHVNKELTTGQAQQLLGCCEKAMRRYKKEITHHFTPGGHWRAYESAVLKYKEWLMQGQPV